MTSGLIIHTYVHAYHVPRTWAQAHALHVQYEKNFKKYIEME